MLGPRDLYPYQLVAAKDIVRDKVFCITDDCGGGKTIIALTAFKIIKKKYPTLKMLVVCTSKGVASTWSNEYKKWSHTKHFKVAVLNQTPVKRLALLNQNDHDIYAISYNSLEWLSQNNKVIQFDYVFADEADCLKGVKSKWRKNLIKAAPKAKWKILASATPKAREEDDYWGLCKYLDNGKCLNSVTATAFRQEYCTHFIYKNRIIYRIDKKKIPKLEKRIKHLFRNYGDQTAKKIPIKTINVYGELRTSSREKYSKLLKEQCVNSIILKPNGQRNDKLSLDPMVLSGKLNQLSSGFLYDDENLRITPDMLYQTTNVRKLIETSKKRRVVKVFDDRMVLFKKMVKTIRKRHGEYQPLAMPYTYQHELVQLQEMFPHGVSDTEEDFIDRWNNNEISELFLQYSRSSKSLNLQYGKGHIFALYSSTFKWVDDYQIIRRMARDGQRAETVYVYRLHIRGTIDDVKTKRLGDRFKGHSRFQKTIIQEIRNDDEN